MRNKIELLKNKLNKIDICCSNEQIEQLVSYYEMLIEKNKVMNLTSITEPEEVIEKHFVDSLAVHQFVKLKEGDRLIDIGTGAGFPGIPLKILFPKLKIVLLDSLNKRITFLEEVIQKLGLKEIECIHGRSEDVARKEEYREKFDFCVSRAVANMSTLAELCIPFVKQNGYFVSYKAGNCSDEIEKAGKAIQKLGGKVEEVVEFELPDTDVNRVFVKIKKEKLTPKKYPRKAGIPGKEPLS